MLRPTSTTVEPLRVSPPEAVAYLFELTTSISGLTHFPDARLGSLILRSSDADHRFSQEVHERSSHGGRSQLMSSPGNPVRFSAAVVATWILVLVHLNTKGTDRCQDS